MAFDTAKELRRAIDTGSVAFGTKSTQKKVLNGDCKLVIASNNSEKYGKEKIKELCKTAEVPFYEFEETGKELGSICGKPFVVSFACVEKPGKSKILEVATQKKTE